MFDFNLINNFIALCFVLFVLHILASFVFLIVFSIYLFKKQNDIKFRDMYLALLDDVSHQRDLSFEDGYLKCKYDMELKKNVNKIR